MQIPIDRLSPEALLAIIQEFVTRDGTDYSSVDNRITAIRKQLQNGTVEIHYDADSSSCQIVPVDRDP